MTLLLQIENISKKYGHKVLFENASFTVYEKQKIGVIGRNGAGKSTLFRLILSQESPDSGNIRILDSTYIGNIEQEDSFLANDTILSYLERKSDTPEWECAKLASEFQFVNSDLQKKVTSFSGGYQMRIKLMAMLLQKPNLLLLDEPTNYLDLQTLLLLEDFLKQYKGAYLIISHDRRFLENTCEETLEIENGKITHFPNKLSFYLEHKALKQETLENYNKKQEKKRKHLQKFVDRFRYQASKATQAQSKIKQIEKIQFAELEATLPTVRIKSPQTENTKGMAFRMDDLVIGYPDKKVAQNINIEIAKGQHIAILGNNGQGKSTFIKTLLGHISPLDGVLKVNPNMKIGYYDQHITSSLDKEQTVEQFLYNAYGNNSNPEEIFKMAGNFLFQDEDIKKTISMLSGGEKSRLCIAGLLLQKYDVLVFDEPTNHLDFQTAENLAHALKDSNLTLLFISHDRTFTNILADFLIEVNNNTVKRRHTSYSEYLSDLKEQTLFQPAKKVKKDPQKKEEKKQHYQEKKDLKKLLIKTEKHLEILKNEKKNIHEFFLKNPESLDTKKLKRLKEIPEEIEKIEHQWLDIYTKIDIYS